jgi:alpha-N-arabinofuranosidase
MKKAGVRMLIITILFVVLFSNKDVVYGKETVSLSINPTKIESRIDEKIYGHFLEHIYHSVNGGLWGELVWNRSFEELPGGAMGKWTIEDDTIVQSMIADNVRLVFGNKDWSDYEYSLEAQKADGAEGFLILFRVLNDEEFYWYNIGGWSNVRSGLEKGGKDRRQGVIGQTVDGGIETGKWYRVRVRCEGAHFQVWLDDKKLLDFTDESNPHLKGSVGIGTWNTKAKYRNINVKSLDGKTLFEGLPKVEQKRPYARYWNFYGDGQIKLSEENPLNSNQCQVIKSDAAEAGIEQQRFCIRKEETYRGSLWARSDTQPSSLVVRLKNGSTTIGEQPITVTSSSWAKYPFTFTPGVSAENATLQIGVTGSETVYLDQVSMMGQDANATGGYRPDLLQAVEDLHPPVIRWPGGCFASAYFWKDGIGPQAQRVKYPIVLWDDQDTDSYGTDEFIRMCHAMGAEPIIVINTGLLNSTCGVSIPNKKTANEYLQDAKDWVQYCNRPAGSTWGAKRAANGHPKPYNVKYWEIDNETWGAGSTAYIAKVQQFVPAMKAVDPNIKIIACGGGGFDQGWNQAVINACANIIDYISIHHYENPNLYAEGPYNYENSIKETAELIKKSKNPGLKIDCSEWNTQSTDWRTGLYAGGILNAFERCAPAFEIGGPALFLRHRSATAWDNAFINFDQCGWFGAPNYVVMKLWREHYGPYRIAIEGESKPLNVVATKSEDGRKIYLKAVNPSDADVEVELLIEEGFTPKKAGMQLVAPGSLNARNTLEKPNAIQPEKGEVDLSGQKARFILPRLSVAVVAVEGQQK